MIINKETFIQQAMTLKPPAVKPPKRKIHYFVENLKNILIALVMIVFFGFSFFLFFTEDEISSDMVEGISTAFFFFLLMFYAYIQRIKKRKNPRQVYAKDGFAKLVLFFVLWFFVICLVGVISFEASIAIGFGGVGFWVALINYPGIDKDSLRFIKKLPIYRVVKLLGLSSPSHPLLHQVSSLHRQTPVLEKELENIYFQIYVCSIKKKTSLVFSINLDEQKFCQRQLQLEEQVLAFLKTGTGKWLYPYSFDFEPEKKKEKNGYSFIFLIGGRDSNTFEETYLLSEDLPVIYEEVTTFFDALRKITHDTSKHK